MAAGSRTRPEVFAQTFPGGAENGRCRWTAAQGRGGAKRAKRSLRRDRTTYAEVMAADVAASRHGEDITAPKALFECPATNNFPLRVADNEQHFPVLVPAARSYRPLTLLLHWQDQLNR